jgi:threonine dehydratase
MKSPSYDDIIEAKERIKDIINPTPFLYSPVLNEMLGANIFVKAENLQPRGAFKIRGAANAIFKRKDEALKNGVIAYSSGNHAQGVALACKYIGAKATIIVPKDVPLAKLKPAQDDGANIIFYDRKTEIREEIGSDLQKKTGAILVPPYDHADVIAGQGTIGLEIIEFTSKHGFEFDYVVTPASGGGLASGIGIALEQTCPNTKIIISEPEGFDDLAQSFAAGERVRVKDINYPSLLDALQAPMSGEITFPILERIGAKAFGISDNEALRAVKFAFENFHLVLEPSGASSLALVMENKIPAKSKNICIIASGGNIDIQILQKALMLS